MLRVDVGASVHRAGSQRNVRPFGQTIFLSNQKANTWGRWIFVHLIKCFIQSSSSLETIEGSWFDHNLRTSDRL